MGVDLVHKSPHLEDPHKRPAMTARWSSDRASSDRRQLNLEALQSSLTAKRKVTMKNAHKNR